MKEILASNPEIKIPCCYGGLPTGSEVDFFKILAVEGEDEAFDMLISFCLGPGQSRFTPTEHVWSSCSLW